MMTKQQSYQSGPNAAALGEYYRQYLTSPEALDEDWRRFFTDLDDEARALVEGMNGGAAPAVAPTGNGHGAAEVAAGVAGDRNLTAGDIRAATLDSIRALMLIRAYRVRGHLEADLDPLGLKPREPHPELDPKSYGFDDADMDRPIFIDNVLGMETATLREIVQAVRQTYCGRIGVEFMHIQDPAQKAWIQERIESIHNQPDFTAHGKRAILERLTAAEAFEQFLNKKYTGTKRFGLDGGEALIPALEQVLKRDPGARAGAQARQPDGPEGSGDRHAAPRPSQRAGQLHGQTLHRDLFRIPGRRGKPRGRRGLRRREVPPGHLVRPGIRRQQRAPVADRQSVASGGGQPGGGGQGPGQAGSGQIRGS
jgi:2-oxoglutarate dehydrogenase complex dehydrogenase (E1) component-like enzyme